MKLVDNKKLHLTYHIEETLSAGIELHGFEVKELRKKIGSLDGARVLVRGGEVFLLGAYIPPYQPANTPSAYDPHRTRRLLVTKEEMRRLASIEDSRSLTLLPGSLYLTRGHVKCDIAFCKKKEAKDKRELIKKDIARRELRDT